MKVLILHPDYKDPGGVAKYYLKLKDKFTLPVEHYITGIRPGEKGILSRIYRMMDDYCRFVVRLKRHQYEIIHINPSLSPKAFLRDGVFLLLARMYKKKTVVFFRGWQESFAIKIQRYLLWLFKFFYGKANVFIVLSEKIGKNLETWGCSQPIYREVTIADDATLKEFDFYKALNDRQRSEKWYVLFLARIVKEKGIYETIEAVSILQTKYPNIELVIAGEGSELENVKAFVAKQGISNIIFTGYVSGEDKKRIYESSHIFCYPTYHGEGLPNAIIESMAFGIPIITRPVGGIVDFFEDKKHGFLSNSQDPDIIANLVERLLVDKMLYKKISLFNYQYAQSNFLASQAAVRLEEIYKSVNSSQQNRLKEGAK